MEREKKREEGGKEWRRQEGKKGKERRGRD